MDIMSQIYKNSNKTLKLKDIKTNIQGVQLFVSTRKLPQMTRNIVPNIWTRLCTCKHIVFYGENLETVTN